MQETPGVQRRQRAQPGIAPLKTEGDFLAIRSVAAGAGLAVESLSVSDVSPFDRQRLRVDEFVIIDQCLVDKSSQVIQRCIIQERGEVMLGVVRAFQRSDNIFWFLLRGR